MTEASAVSCAHARSPFAVVVIIILHTADQQTTPKPFTIHCRHLAFSSDNRTQLCDAWNMTWLRWFLSKEKSEVFNQQVNRAFRKKN